MKRILIIEDDPAILKGLTISLEAENFQVETASNGECGLQFAQNKQYDLIILDLMLPGKNGLDVCRDIRSQGLMTPILVLTSKKEEMDKVLGLEIGADDYVTKPFSINELMARIRALIRRTSDFTKKVYDTYSFGKIKIDFKKLTALRSDKPIKFSIKEFEILRYFIDREEEVVTRDMLLNEVWGYDIFPTTRTIDTFILNLRKKIEDNPSKPKHLVTVHKAGYKFIK